MAGDLHHVALRLAYDGSQFDAYPRDPGAERTVEGSLVEALGFEGYVEGSLKTGSRTDKGVCAVENVCRATLLRPHLKGLVPAVQAHLPAGLWLTGVAPVAPGWNPRHAAWRRYSYVARARAENLDLMRHAAAQLIGEHDVRAFARVEPPRQPVRRIDRFDIESHGGAWRFTVQGPSFLWNQVRRMVDACLCVGRGTAPPDAITESLESGQPHPVFKIAPPEGLLLERVHYEELEWAKAAGKLRAGPVERAWQAAAVRHQLLDAVTAGNPRP